MTRQFSTPLAILTSLIVLLAANKVKAEDFNPLPPAGTVISTDDLTTAAQITPAAGTTTPTPNAGPNAGYVQLGVEGFGDHYTEPEPDVGTHAVYGSVTANYANTGPELYGAAPIFYAVDTRFSYGRNDYHSPSGNVNNVPEYEAEGRLRAGLEFPLSDGPNSGTITPYTGIGVRAFLDNGNGYVTNLGKGAYNRQLVQSYLPVGVTVNIPRGNFNVTPTLEYDELIYGQVRSSLRDFIGRNVDNEQHNGFGVRGDLQVGQTKGAYGWSIGPFFRYWDIANSSFSADPGNPTHGWVEPHNHRWQVGGEARFLFK